MVLGFGLFSRKREPQAELQAEPSATQSQLRTPSPSVDSNSLENKQLSPTRDPPLTPSPPPEPQLTPTGLRDLIQSIPPQILHSYTLTHLHPSHGSIDPDTLAHLSSFFAQLTPPPKLHCARCHKGFFEIENTDRSCLVAHDDDSAEVERVSSKAKGKGTLYETLWACCGKTVEGDGDMGPPDGWCYEGKHTPDPKRARFRADSTLHDDKLTSCERLRCHEPPRSSRNVRKRRRTLADGAEDEDEEDDDHQSAVSSRSHADSVSTSPRSSTGGKRRRPGKKPRTEEPQLETQPNTTASEPDQMDVDAPALTSTPAVPNTPPSPKAKAKAQTKPKSSRAATKPKPPASAKSLTTPKTSSPLVLAPPFVSRSVSPEPPSKARIVVSMKPAPNAVKPKSSTVSLKSKSQVAASSKAATASGAGHMSAPSSPGRTRKDSGTSSKAPRRKGKAKDLIEVVDSSVDAERWAIKA